MPELKKEESKKEEPKKSNAGKKIVLLLAVGFIIDVAQAVIIFNSGKGAEAKANGIKYKWKFPRGGELMKTAGLVLVTSILTGLLVTGAERMLFKDEQMA